MFICFVSDQVYAQIYVNYQMAITHDVNKNSFKRDLLL